jgi:hypothetical protein
MCAPTGYYQSVVLAGARNLKLAALAIIESGSLSW